VVGTQPNLFQSQQHVVGTQPNLFQSQQHVVGTQPNLFWSQQRMVGTMGPMANLTYPNKWMPPPTQITTARGRDPT